MSNLSGIFSSVKGRRIITACLSLLLLLVGEVVLGQGSPLNRFGGMGGSGSGGKNGDTLVKRKEDTITINFRYLDSSRFVKLDSSIEDISRKIPRPNTWINLGNDGAAARNLVFSPRMQSGWDAGFHAYDLYLFKTEDTRLFNTTKPYTELGYMQASQTETFVDLIHTQNVKPNWNLGGEFRLINSLGTFGNANTNHTNYRLSSWYQSHSKRYQNFFVMVVNKINASENGGLVNPADLDSSQYSNQGTVPVKLGNNLARGSGNLFSSTVTTGTRYRQSTYLFRQQYDLGQKDSIVTDTSVIPLFYPRVRLEHTMSYSSYNYWYVDTYYPGYSYTLDSTYYQANFGTTLNPTDSFSRQDKWGIFSNDFSVYTFPDSKNPQQFLKLGATIDLIKGTFDTSNNLSGFLLKAHSLSEQNVFGHAEYRNKTRNQKWDIEAYGRLYLNGLDAGDYNAYISLRRYISREVGYFQAGFENANRKPGYVFQRASSLNLDYAQTSSLKKENTTHVFASLDQPSHHLTLTGSYYLLSNYSFWSNYNKADQASSLFNVLEISLKKQFTIYRHWHWRTETIVQQVAGSSPVHVPLLTSFNQVGYDGKLGFKNLVISFGTELRYISPYKADGFSPATGQFFTQGDSTITQRLPDINFYLHLRVRSFTAYVRTENINSIKFQPRGFGWYGNNFVAPGYPSPGLIIRVGVFWSFIN